MLCRRSKYVDFFIFASFCLLFVYAYFSRQVLLDRLRRKELERERLEHNANSLKEELKIVYYHTAKLEEALKAEQDNHKVTNSKLASQSQDFKVNLTNLQKQYANKLREKDYDIKTYSLENEDLKSKHKLVEEQYVILTKEHKKVAIQVQSDFDKLKKAKEEESVRLQGQIQDSYNQKVYFQKKALTYEDEYRKTLKKLVRCKSVLARRNSSTHTHGQVNQKKRKSAVSKKIRKVITEVLPTEVVIKPNIIHSKVLPAQMIIDLTHPKVLPTEIVNTFNQPRVIPTEKVNNHELSKDLITKNINDESRIAKVESPAELPVRLQTELPVKNSITETQVNIGTESKKIISEELSHKKILSPDLKEKESKAKPVGTVDDITDNT